VSSHDRTRVDDADDDQLRWLQWQTLDALRSYDGDDPVLLAIREDPLTGAYPNWAPTVKQMRQIWGQIDAAQRTRSTCHTARVF
jgi:hypothetical protein